MARKKKENSEVQPSSNRTDDQNLDISEVSLAEKNRLRLVQSELG